MADWKQITARIRRARTGKDPAGQLSNLFSKTRDAMVAFELARYFETTGNNDDAGKWYLTAAQRFRRADWKTKAQESATRLGATTAAEVPAASATSEAAAGEATESSEATSAAEGETETALPEAAVGEPEAEAKPTREPAGRRPERGGRTRGKRGGRDHRASGRRGENVGAVTRDARPAATSSSRSHTRHTEEPEEKGEETPTEEAAPSRFERAASGPSLRGRSGDPGLSSRLSQLEMNYRRLVACEPVNSNEAGAAPAGPGVWVLMDSDQSS